MIGSENTRLVLQFTKIDLEEQNDCLYDYISIEDDENYENLVHSELSINSPNDRVNLSEDYMADAMNEDVDESSEDQKRIKRSSSMQSRKSTDNKQISAEPSFQSYVRWCGTHESNMSRFDFISASNTVLIYFHSDYSVSGSGWSMSWKAISLSGCPTKTFTSSDDFNSISSPNYPNVLLNNLDCKYIIYGANNKKIWLEFESFDLVRDAVVEIDLGNGPFVPYRKSQQLNDGAFVSYQNRVTIHLRTGDKPKGAGFHLIYKTSKRHNQSIIIQLNLKIKLLALMFFSSSSSSVGNRQQRNIVLLNKANGILNHLNYPQPQPSNIDFTQHIVAPLGEVILLEVHNVGITEADCHTANRIEVCNRLLPLRAFCTI